MGKPVGAACRSVRCRCIVQCLFLPAAHVQHGMRGWSRRAQVLVMHDGNKLEYDTVPALLARRDGAFRAMVLGAGISHEALGSISEDREAPANGA